MATAQNSDSGKPLAGLTGFQRDCLRVILELGAPHGLAIKQELEQHYENEINHGRLYPNLDTLEDKKYIAKGKVDERTNSYELTDYGKVELSLHRDWWEDSA